MRYPNKTYQVPSDGRNLIVVIEPDPVVKEQIVFKLEYADGGAVLYQFAFSGLDFEKIGQNPLGDNQFLLDTVAYDWAEEWFKTTKLAFPTGETREWLKDPKLSFNTADYHTWKESGKPNSTIQRMTYPVYEANMKLIGEGQ